VVGTFFCPGSRICSLLGRFYRGEAYQRDHLLRCMRCVAVRGALCAPTGAAVCGCMILGWVCNAALVARRRRVSFSFAVLGACTAGLFTRYLFAFFLRFVSCRTALLFDFSTRQHSMTARGRRQEAASASDEISKIAIIPNSDFTALLRSDIRNQLV
jgi:hypothetical protein